MTESLTAKIPRMHSPVNRQAAAVIGSGNQYKEPEYKAALHSAGPLPTRSWPVTSRSEDDLTGKRYGRFTVIGLYTETQSWVVRCDCGIYTTRKSKALKSALGGPNMMCARCDRRERIKNNEGLRKCEGLYGASLHKAALPMYRAIQQFLIQGNTPAALDELRKAARVCEEIPGDAAELDAIDALAPVAPSGGMR